MTVLFGSSRPSRASFSDTMQRIGVQRALLWNVTGLLAGRDYECAFECELIHGSWKWSPNFLRKYRNGNMPSDIWPDARRALIEARRDLNMTQDWNLTGKDFGETPRLIRQAGREAVLKMMKHTREPK